MPLQRYGGSGTKGRDQLKGMEGHLMPCPARQPSKAWESLPEAGRSDKLVRIVYNTQRETKHCVRMILSQIDDQLSVILSNYVCPACQDALTPAPDSREGSRKSRTTPDALHRHTFFRLRCMGPGAQLAAGLES